GERQVWPGQLVSPGTQVIPFVDKIKWVMANYRETQLTNMKVGDPVEIRIDAYPGKTFRGKVIEIAPASGSQFALLPPDNATGNYTKVVQRIPVKIAFDDENVATSLQPGLSVIATVRTRHCLERAMAATTVTTRPLTPVEIARTTAAVIPWGISTRPILGILGVLVGAGLVTLTGRMLSLGMADLRGHLGISYDQAAWLDSAYNASLMFIGPFSVYVGGLLGPRRVLLFAAGVFAVTCAFLPLIHNYSLLVTALIVAGLTSGT